jgi:cellulose synthase/poly-beta-1,6-N-acetylglucosamine synthase-like glycosyltransferase/peptidoglycan/xylan/chitin deacetylase (PgdA/CDA1 family)/spore germination protein YaaH
VGFLVNKGVQPEPFRPVFFDSTGRRRLIVSAVTWAGGTLLGVLTACLIVTSLFGPALPGFARLSVPRELSSQRLSAPASKDEPAYGASQLRAAAIDGARTAQRYAYLVNWDDNSFSSLRRNARALDYLIVEWLHLEGAAGDLAQDAPAKQALVMDWLKTNAADLKVLPSVNNYDEGRARWDTAAVEAMLTSAAARSNFAVALDRFVTQGRYAGLVLDLEEIPTRAQADYVKLVRELADMFNGRDLQLLVALPPEGLAYDHAGLAAAADALILMSYDEHTEKGAPGPLASQGWFETVLAQHLKNIPADKLIVSVGSYGYDWPQGKAAQEISVQEAWELLEESRASLNFDAKALNPTFSYLDDAAKAPHQVWYLDAVTAYDQIAVTLPARPRGLALWRLGTEDPSIWSVLGRGRLADGYARNEIKTLRAGYDVLYKGKGEVLSASGVLQEGTRQISHNVFSNLITGQQIVAFPKATTITRWGAGSDKVLSLTFDDGPDPRYTPKILDILAEKGVQATFFIVGSAGALNTELLERIYREGHEIGNHTFTHLNTTIASPERLAFEINATQRLIESTVGARTTLFRAPYGDDLEPQTIDAAQALTLAGSLGYLSIGMDIDPKDWRRPLASQIVTATIEQAAKGDGKVILLHDAGGIRTATVEALPQIIDKLREAGFRFVPVHELLGLSRDEVMPRIGPEDAWITTSNYAGFAFFKGMNSFLTVFFYVGITLGTVRLLWVAGFALVHVRRERRRQHQRWMPASVAVLIPAYNEEKVICNSIHALLASTERDFKIIVIDDGSSDATADVVRRTFAASQRVSVLTKANGGKWAALNYGLAHTDAEVVVTLDADTQFEPDALRWLVRHFVDPKVAAVAGAAIVGNQINLITRFQALEYVTNQNLDRRALEVVNGITVVPGAIGAWRRSTLLDVGGFLPDTLAEDSEATVRLARGDWKVLYEPRAAARTEAPETIRSFMKQRLRWMFGTLQVACKNLPAVWRARPIGLGLFGLPNIIVFQFVFTLIAPAMDLMLLWSLISGVNNYVSGPADAVFPSPALRTVGAYWLYFQILEVATAALAIAIEHRGRTMWRLLPLLVLQRFCYRQLLYVTALRAALAALKGHMLGWNKLIRTGRVASHFGG